MTSILTNITANPIAQSVRKASDELRSLSVKLSTGQGITTAFEDAAGLSIGSGLKTDTNTLKTVLKTTGQAKLILNIADGALQNIASILERQKSLAVQANSGSLSNIERGFLDLEFQNGTDEIDRLVNATTFNGVKLLDGNVSKASLNIEFNDGGSGTAETIAIAGVHFDFIATAGGGTTTTDLTTAGGAATQLVLDGGTGYDAETGAQKAALIASVINGSTAGLDAAVTTAFANISAKVVDNEVVITSSNDFTLEGITAFSSAASSARSNSVEEDITAVIASKTITDNSLIFQVGFETTDVIKVGIADANSKELFDLTGTDGTINVANLVNAATASNQLDEAIDEIKEMRATVGSLQARFEFASNNIATSIQNTEAAAAGFLDADIANVSTLFAQSQVRMQASISVLAQVNQLPMALLKLINQ